MVASMLPILPSISNYFFLSLKLVVRVSFSFAASLLPEFDFPISKSVPGCETVGYLKG
jgi:hypothetical protein